MKRVFINLILLFTIFLILSGCWNRRELNNIAIAVAMGIDKHEDQYAVSVQIVNPGEIAEKSGGGGKGAPVVTYREIGDTVHEALRKILTDSPRKIYLSHVRMVIFGESLAEKGIGQTLDFLSRDHEMRTNFSIAIAKGVTAEKMLTIYSMPQEIIPANHMFKSLEASDESWAATSKITLDELISDIIKEGKEGVITGIELAGDKNHEDADKKENIENIKPITNIHFSGMAAFKSDKLIGWLNEDESKGYNYVRGKVKSTVVQVACSKGGMVSVELIRTKEKTEGMIQNEQPKIDVVLQAEGNVSEVDCSIDLTKVESINDLEIKMEEQIKSAIDAALQKAQKEFKADIFGFGEIIRRKDQKLWKKIKGDWEKIFSDLQVNVTVDAKIRKLGTISKSLHDKLKE